MAQNVKKNTLLNILKTFSTIVYPLITFPYISRVLLPENVGKINFGNSIVSYFSLIATLGVSTYATRECARVKDDSYELRNTASEIFTINIISTVIAYIGLAVTLVMASPLKNYRSLICIQSATIVFTTLGTDWINMAMEDFRFVTVRTLCVQIISLLLMFVFVRNQEDYLLYALISVLASSGANVANIFYRKKYCRLKIVLSNSIKKHLKSIILMFSITISQTIYCNSDMTLLGLFKGDYDVGLYSTSVKIYNLVNSTVASILWVVMPQLSAAFSKKDYKKIGELLSYALNFIVILGMPCVVGINVICPELLSVIGGSEFIGASVSLHILTISLVFSFLGGWIGNMMLLPAGREEICLKSSVICAIINIGLNFVLIPLWGLNAAAATTAVSECVGVLILLKYIDKNIVIADISKMICAPMVGCVGIILVAIIGKLLFPSSIVRVIYTVLVSIPVYISSLFFCKDDFAVSFIAPMIKKLTRYSRR